MKSWFLLVGFLAFLTTNEAIEKERSLPSSLLAEETPFFNTL